MTLLSAALIVRNEQQVLDRCLRSISGLVDEIVVVDTGSVDGTRAIARRYTPRLFDFRWSDDFSAARNFALEQARGEWILYIDADESILPRSGIGLPVLLNDPVNIAATVRFVPRHGYTPYREYRLFRRDPRIRFHGTIHETVLPDIERIRLRESRVVCAADLTIVHHGYEGDMTSKHLRNLPMLTRQLASEPGRVYSWHHLGLIHEALNRPACAREAWIAGVHAARRKSRMDPADCLPYVELMRVDFVAGRSIAQWVNECTGTFTENYLIVQGRARLSLQQGEYEQAKHEFAKLSLVDPDTLMDDNIAYDKCIFTEYAWEGLGLCHFQLGEFSQSAKCFALAEQANPHRLEFRIKRMLAECRCR